MRKTVRSGSKCSVFQSFQESHHTVAQEGQTEPPAADSITNNHFIAIVRKKDRIYELGENYPIQSIFSELLFLHLFPWSSLVNIVHLYKNQFSVLYNLNIIKNNVLRFYVLFYINLNLPNIHWLLLLTDGRKPCPIDLGPTSEQSFIHVCFLRKFSTSHFTLFQDAAEVIRKLMALQPGNFLFTLLAVAVPSDG